MATLRLNICGSSHTCIAVCPIPPSVQTVHPPTAQLLHVFSYSGCSHLGSSSLFVQLATFTSMVRGLVKKPPAGLSKQSRRRWRALVLALRTEREKSKGLRNRVKCLKTAVQNFKHQAENALQHDHACELVSADRVNEINQESFSTDEGGESASVSEVSD